MAHPHLSSEINDVISKGEKNPGIDIKTQQKGAMFEIKTAHTNCTIVVVNPKEQEIAMITDNPKIKRTDLWYYIGAGWSRNSGLTKVGWIVVGALMRMRRLSGGLIETSPVQSFSVLNDPEKAKRIIDEAETRRPEFMTEEEERNYNTEFAKKVEELIVKEFPARKHKCIREIIGRFGNNDAKGTVLGAFSQAQKSGKLNQAIQLLERDWKENWQYQPPKIAGNPEFMPINAHRWNAFYKELDVPLPGTDNN